MAVKEIDTDSIVKQLESQLRSTEMWIGKYRQYNDESSKRNAAFAIGRLDGIRRVAASLDIIPEALQEAVDRAGKVWDEM